MYYKLTYTGSSDKTRLHDYILNGSKPLNIGQGISCEVLLPESKQYESELYASVIQCTEGKGWYIVRRTDCYDILVNGTVINIAQTLNNGDVLSFSNDDVQTNLKFEVFDDGEFDDNSRFIYNKHTNHKPYYVFTLMATLLAVGIGIYALINPSQKDLRNTDLSLLKQSVYHITTDSVYLLCDTLIDGEHRQMAIDSIELSQVAEGTAFLTEDNLFVTARHCIEPWINDEEWDGISSSEKMSPEVRLATKAETENRMVGYEKYTLRAHCVVSKGFERYDYNSTDFHMNKSRDMVMRLGTPKEVIYWRTIMPIATRRNMELGDFAYTKARSLDTRHVQSDISMAKWDDIVRFAKSNNHEIVVIGYPLNDNDADIASEIYGNLTGLEENNNVNVPTGCLQLSASINPGNSGGPVFAKIGNEIKVIGIVSKADARASQGLFWAVPITEVLNMHEHGDYIEEDPETYRR